MGVRLNKAKRNMLEGKPALGATATLGSSLGAQALARAGVDFVMVDDQHGIWEPESMMAAFYSTWSAGAVPMARVGRNDFYAIGAMLDRGALGIIVPMVHTVEDAMAAAFATRYPPFGGRSMGPYGCGVYGSDYVERANEEVFLAVQIESKQGLENVEEILAVEGIDGCWVGPVDLAASLGVEFGSTTHEDAIVRIREACGKTNKIPGIYCAGQGEHRLRQGFLFLTPSSDVIHLGIGAKQTIDALRGLDV
jgi:4-hydroxy-2-oxoheptanedioate aldolase